MQSRKYNLNKTKSGKKKTKQTLIAEEKLTHQDNWQIYKFVIFGCESFIECELLYYDTAMLTKDGLHAR